MKGVLRPCRHRLGRDLHRRWMGHLCGLCLSLRDTGGQAARALTGYDILLVPILVEAQTGRLPTTDAGPCALRGFRTAEVVDAATPAMQAGTAAALLAGGASLADKVNDGDTPVWLRPAAARTARRLDRVGAASAAACGLDGADLSAAPERSRAVEGLAGASLDQLLEPAGTAVAGLFAHTALTAGVPANGPALRAMGDSFGRLVHLIDAVEDRAADRRNGQFNPLEATGTDDEAAGELASRLRTDIRRHLDDLELVDDALVRALLGPTLDAAATRVWPGGGTAPARHHHRGALVGVAMLAQLGVFGGGRWGGRGGGRWGNDPYDPYGGRRGYGRRGGFGPSCGEMLACDCCANCACNECCGGDDCCCCV